MMTTIENLQSITIQNINNEDIRGEVVTLLEDYKQALDKEDFIAVNQAEMDMIHELVKQHLDTTSEASEELPCDCDDETEQETVKPTKSDTIEPKKPAVSDIEKTKKATTPKQENAQKSKPQQEKQPKEAKKRSSKKKNFGKRIKEATKKISEEIKVCRAKIRKYNEEKRKSEPEKRPPSRYEKIKKQFISIGNLRPPKLKNNIEVDRAIQRVLGKAHRDVLEIYQMNALKKIDRDQKELQEKLQKNKAA